jgi:hypothetical protein
LNRSCLNTISIARTISSCQRQSARSHGCCDASAGALGALLRLLGALHDKSLVRGQLLLVLLGTLPLQCNAVTLALELQWGDETLNLGRLLVLLSVRGGDFTTHNVLPDIILCLQVEKLADLVDTLWSQAHRSWLVGQPWNGLWALLHNNEVEDREVMRNDASTDGLALHLTSAALSVALATFLQQETNTVGTQDTLHHWETLLVVSTGDLEAVALEFITERVGIDFLGHPLIEEREQHAIFIDHDTLLLARFGARVKNESHQSEIDA